jgi:hypothetical protein
MKPSVSITVAAPGEETLCVSGSLRLLRELMQSFDGPGTKGQEAMPIPPIDHLADRHKPQEVCHAT